MGEEVQAYYSRKKETLLKDFRKTMELMKKDREYRQLITDSWEKELIWEYQRIIPEIPYFKGYRQRMFNQMLLITAQVLAAYRVLKRKEKTPAEIWETCHDALDFRLQQIPERRKRLINRLWNNPFRMIMMRRAKKNVKETLGHFKLEYIPGKKEDFFDYGINYTQCGHHKFLAEQGAEELLPYICLADISLSDAFGWGLARTQTLGDGDEFCDFRFTRGGSTTIASKKPEIQEIIDQWKAKKMRL